MLNFIDHKDVFVGEGEYHYRYHTQINPNIYPQVHNFYEIILVTSGILHLRLCETGLSLQAGSLILIRPGDIHSKSGEKCSHINLAFPTKAVNSLFEYLCDENSKTLLAGFPYVRPVFLSHQALGKLEKKIQALNTIHVDEWAKGRTIMRNFLFEVIAQYVLPAALADSGSKTLPDWLDEALQAWQMEDHRQEGLDFFCKFTGYTKAHLCRTFKRYLGVSPSVYLNQQRLNYAVNLLLHSDHRIIDIAYAAGFKSPSRFYNVFRNNYGIAPKQFYAQQIQWS